jgi:hypothetical protein
MSHYDKPFKHLTQEETDKTFKLITSNGCREMEEIRFNQAVNEIISNNMGTFEKSFRKDYIVDFQKYINEATNLLLCNSRGIVDNRILHNITPLEVLDNLEYFANQMGGGLPADTALRFLNDYTRIKIKGKQNEAN